MEEWYYAQNREKCGPISHAQLLEFLRTGVITPGSLVWTNGMPNWLPAIQVPGLLGDAPPAEQAAPAPSPAANTAHAPETQVAQPVGAASGAQPTSTEGAVPTGSSANPWDEGAAPEATPVDTESEGEDQIKSFDANAKATSALSFNRKRPKPPHRRATTKLKTLIVRIAALVIAVAILGGGGYLGAQYLGLFEPEVDTRVRYLPDHPDFVVSVNLPKVMSIAQSVGVDPQGLTGGVSATALPFDTNSVQDITFAGNVHEKQWVVIATLSQEIDPKTLFPGGSEPEDSTRAGGTKIYYDREMANIGMDFAFAMPSKTTMLVGPVETLKEVLKRRGAPVVAEAFQTLLDEKNSDAWLAGAADVNALWRLAEDGLPIDLNSEERWLAESIGSVSFAWSGIGEYDFKLSAHCKNAKDAPLIAERAQAMMKDQRKRLLETMTTLGQPVNAQTKTLWDGIAVKVANGVIHVSQHIDRSMLELGSRQLAATGVLQP